MSEQNKIILNEVELKILREGFETATINEAFDIVYITHQIQNSFLILEGGGEIIHRNKNVEKLELNALYGLNYLASGNSVPFSCRIFKSSKILTIGKSQMLHALESPNNPLNSIFKKFLSV